MVSQGFGQAFNWHTWPTVNHSNSDYLSGFTGNEILSWHSRSGNLPRKFVNQSFYIFFDSVANQLLGCFLISTYYKREDSQKRFAVHYCSTVTATVCGGLLASAIAKMDGIRGIHNWRWIFILEGVFTVIVGIFSFFLVADFPENAKWLNEEERNFVVNRAKCTDEIDVITPRVFLQFFKDTKNVLAAIMYFCKFCIGFCKLISKLIFLKA